MWPYERKVGIDLFAWQWESLILTKRAFLPESLP